MLKSVRAQNVVYAVTIVQRCELRLLPMSGHVFIRLHGLRSLTLVFPGLNVAY